MFSHGCIRIDFIPQCWCGLKGVVLDITLGLPGYLVKGGEIKLFGVYQVLFDP